MLFIQMITLPIPQCITMCYSYVVHCCPVCLCSYCMVVTHTQRAHCVQELAVMVARSRNGDTKAFPVVETIHKDNICHTTQAPARVPPDTLLKAQQVAERAVACLEGGPRTFACAVCVPFLSFQLRCVCYHRKSRRFVFHRGGTVVLSKTWIALS